MLHKLYSIDYVILSGGSMSVEVLFRQKLALGSNFCNRVAEQAQLESHITGVRPTLIMSPCRYGKTSLCI